MATKVYYTIQEKGLVIDRWNEIGEKSISTSNTVIPLEDLFDMIDTGKEIFITKCNKGRNPNTVVDAVLMLHDLFPKKDVYVYTITDLGTRLVNKLINFPEYCNFDKKFIESHIHDFEKELQVCDVNISGDIVKIFLGRKHD